MFENGLDPSCSTSVGRDTRPLVRPSNCPISVAQHMVPLEIVDPAKANALGRVRLSGRPLCLFRVIMLFMKFDDRLLIIEST